MTDHIHCVMSDCDDAIGPDVGALYTHIVMAHSPEEVISELVTSVILLRVMGEHLTDEQQDDVSKRVREMVGAAPHHTYTPENN